MYSACGAGGNGGKARMYSQPSTSDEGKTFASPAFRHDCFLRRFSRHIAPLPLPAAIDHLQPGSRVWGPSPRRDRQMDGECAALAGCAGHRHAAAVSFDNAAHDAQAEPVAVDLMRLCLGAAVERLEHMWQVGWGDAEPAIFDDDLDLATAPGSGLTRAHANPRGRTAVLDCVADQVL